MRLTTREKLNGTVDEVHALLIDPAFQEAKCAATTNNGVYTVKVGGGADGHRVRTERQLPSDGLPDMARSFVGDHLTIIEVLDWSALGPDGVAGLDGRHPHQGRAAHRQGHRAARAAR